ncbi:alcohol dehydrogenase family protein [Shewanella sp. YLB-07]|uniref:alcohol dehydrogenase family protein n=1 Tax=Shewanella sp. YLB-07 TaxID=2601268 RepID=UPI00128AF2CB|nr:alcohol dehydrogenase family protein [Shewanella sp. YLB-07]MPY21597.1 zinc-binding dehydrogenase [Shewanella sp. YLB-07]
MNKLPKKMSGVLLTGHGGLEKLEYRTDLPVPIPENDEVLIKVGASAVNNTDINTRVGWYSKCVKEQTDAGAVDSFQTINEDDASWSGIPVKFPRIQGADCCGEIVAVGEQVSSDRIGERVLVRTLQQTVMTPAEYSCITYGSECDGGFSQYTKVLATEAFPIQSFLSDAELASFPCSYSTAENMIDRANVKANDTVLITGASGGVGSAAVQLVKRRHAEVIAICSENKKEQLYKLGADKVIQRGLNLLNSLGKNSVDVVIDLVAGKQWPELPELLRRGGRYTVAGAIAGPIVELDIRTLYLKDLSFFGCTYQSRAVFENLIRYIERSELQPLVAKQYSLLEIKSAQQDFMAKNFVGKLILLPSQ